MGKATVSGGIFFVAQRLFLRACAGFVLGSICCLTHPAAAQSDANTEDDGSGNIAGAAKSVSLVDIWLAFPDVDTISWPYSYIRAKTTDELQHIRKQDLLRELGNLDSRLGNGGYHDYRQAIAQWRSALESTKPFREPGNWSPSWLMVHPNQNPPLAAITALGACQLPAWIEVWDSTGVNRLDWQPGLTLSRVTRHLHPVAAGRSDLVTVVRPTGAIDRYGVAPWNFADTQLQPGARVIAALPLAGEGLLWIRDATARFLAHSVTGVECRELPINGGAR